MQNCATTEGTRSYGHTTEPVRLGKTEWWVSPVGFGGYRIHPQMPEHREALKLALTSGCNLVDTSTNYGDGGSETLIGETLRELFNEGSLRRDQVVVVSKVGYIQGENLRLAQQRKDRGFPFTEVVEHGDDLWHSISSDFLKDQITRSLKRLGLEKIDLLLLHNPEYYLKSEGDHAEYYRRIREAFKHLESEVAAGRIQHFGISSNTFPAPRESADFTSLTAICDMAKEIGAHHFSVIQFPLNLYEPEAAFEMNNDGKTLLETAEVKDLGTLINRPLNAFYGEKLIRLAEFPTHDDKDIEEALKESFLEALSVESEYSAKEILPAKDVAWAHILRHNFDKIADLEGWRNILEYQIEPALEEAERILSAHPEHQEWLVAYREAIDKLCNDLSDYLEGLSALLSKRIDKLLDQACPALTSSPSLSQKAIRIYRSVPGVSCILVGMRTIDYVRDTLSLEAQISPEEAMTALDAIQEDVQSA